MATKQILIVDDSPTELKLIASSFTGAGYDIITAGDGEEAVQKAMAEKPDVIVLDVIMPKMNGFQACRKIKSTPEIQHIPIIILTSKKEKSDEFWGKKQGADKYLTKPFESEELLEAVAEYIS